MLPSLRSDVDEIQDDLARASGPVPPPPDPDLPGGGRFYCVQCSRYFISEEVLQLHYATKQHRKRVRVLGEKPYSQLEAEMAAGMAPPDNGPREGGPKMKE